MVVNHIDKTFVTSDAATILKELEVAHPAAKIIVMATLMQQQEYGDGTNVVVTLAGQFLAHAQNLIKMGLHPSQILTGYQQASKKALQILAELKCYQVKDLKNEDQIAMLLQPALTSKLSGYGDFLSKKVAKACILSLPDQHRNFDVDNVRTVQIMGSSILDSDVMRGFIIKRDAETSIKRVDKPTIAIYGCSIDTQTADTKGTVLIKNAEQMLNYAKGQETMAEKAIINLVNAGVNLVITGGTISNICLHYLQKYKIMAVKIASKFELKRVARATSTSVLSKLQAPKPDDLGNCDSCFVEEIGSEKIVKFMKDTSTCKLSTILIRGSTKGLMDDIERAVDDAVAVYRALIKSDGFVGGAGSTETVLSLRLQNQAKAIKGLDQYSYSRYAKAFQIIPKILAENAGMESNDAIAKFISANVDGQQSGLKVDTKEFESIDKLKIYDHLQTKMNAVRLASQAALTILRVDQIIIAKPSGGPKMKGENKNWDNDD